MSLLEFPVKLHVRAMSHSFFKRISSRTCHSYSADPPLPNEEPSSSSLCLLAIRLFTASTDGSLRGFRYSGRSVFSSNEYFRSSNDLVFSGSKCTRL